MRCCEWHHCHCDSHRATSLLSFRREITPSNPKGPGGKEGVEGEQGATSPWWGQYWGQPCLGTILGTALSLGACAILGHPKTLVEGNKSQAWLGALAEDRHPLLSSPAGTGALSAPAQPENEKPPRGEKREPPPREN